LKNVEELYIALRDGIHRYLVASGLDSARAMDATHEAFLRLHVALRGGERIENERSWVYQVAHNLAMDGLRRQSREFVLGNELANSLCTGVNNAEEDIIQRERLRAFRAALQLLSPQQRRCLELRSQGLKYREIAEILQVDMSTVGESLARGMRKMRKWSKCET
jgi:RNA polymerase sigma-70 factor, ECF subfamily